MSLNEEEKLIILCTTIIILIILLGLCCFSYIVNNKFNKIMNEKQEYKPLLKDGNNVI